MKKHIIMASVMAGLMLSTGCGDSTPGLSGTVAQGKALIAELTIKGSQGKEITASSDSDGSYSIRSLHGLTPPYIIKATTADGLVLFSYVAGGSNVANVTPFTSYIVDQAADASGASNASYLYSHFANYDISTTLVTEMDQLNAIIAAIMASYNVSGFNHFTSAFSADHTGYDALLDGMDIEMMGDDVIIRTGGQILETLPYDVSESNLTVSGYVSNAFDGMGVTGSTLQFFNPYFSASAQTVSGDYNVSLAFGRSYDVTISADGYMPVVFNNLSTFEISNFSMATVPLIPDTVTGPGAVNGSVIDARTGRGIANVTLAFREGLNNHSGPVVATAATDSYGHYDISTVETGNYTIAYSADGYATRYIDALVLGGSTRTFDTQLVSASFALSNSEGALATVILEWGANPSDLDSHLTGPTTTGDRFHLAYYQDKIVSETFAGSIYDIDEAQPCLTAGVIASLDLDDVSSFGPETTTICQGYEGTFNFYVHHFSGSETIETSPTHVTVITMNGTTMSWTAPATDATTVQSWHVFDIDNYGNIVPVNTYISNDSSAFQSPGLQTAADEAYIFENLPAK